MAFGFDSFMDVIANVIGIIIRFIIVAWVGARSYHTMMEETPPAPPQPKKQLVSIQPPSVDWDAKITKVRYELQRYTKQKKAAQQDAQEISQKQRTIQAAIATVDKSHKRIQAQKAALKTELAKQLKYEQTVQGKLESTASQKQSILEELEKLKSAPPKRKVLRYRTPISRPVTAEELHFECKAGRVTFVDFPAFLAEIRRGLMDKGNLLKTQWSVSGTTQSVGAFRARYTIERRTNFLDAMVKSDAPTTRDGFSYGLSRVMMEPMIEERGEPAKAALASGSAFRDIIDSAFPQQTAVVFWVYPDSFPLFRQLRDFLYEREFEVAGRPLPMGVQIGISKNGTASQAQ